MANINIRIDEKTKEKADILFKEMGITISSAINLFLKQSIKEQGLPFKPSLNKMMAANNDVLDKLSEELIKINDKAYTELAK